MAKSSESSVGAPSTVGALAAWKLPPSVTPVLPVSVAGQRNET